MATDQYAAADERAREARRAGLQAKKDEQPPNTARSYASKQREWKVGLFFTGFYNIRTARVDRYRDRASPSLRNLGQLANGPLEVVPGAPYGR
jgi:hypothetical protein